MSVFPELKLVLLWFTPYGFILIPKIIFKVKGQCSDTIGKIQVELQVVLDTDQLENICFISWLVIFSLRN